MIVPGNYLSEHRTKRLFIRPLKEKHISPWIDFLRHPEATRLFPEDRKKDPENAAAKWIEGQQERYTDGRFGLLALHLEDGTFIGQCGLLKQELDGDTFLEIGYHLLPEYWGKGFATEAAAYFRHYAKEHAIAPFVISIIHRENLRSQAVAGRNGLQPWKETSRGGQPVTLFRHDF
jgi:[ribosomal protein S5]-alanine N-acetyltransferase